MQHLSDLGRVGLGSRLKRISDYLISEVNAIYKEAGIRFEASCFPLLSLLERYGAMSLREAEYKMGTTHSYISQKAKYLADEGLIDMRSDPYDGRARQMALTDRGRALIEQARPYWKAMDKAFAELLHPDERQVFQALRALEDRFMAAPLRNKVKEVLQSPEARDIHIHDYKPEYKKAFENLNLEWLEKNFTLTAFDREAFADPEAVFLSKGGDVFFAVSGGAPVGTAALHPIEDGFELCKMGVDPRFRGAGTGRMLIEEAIKRAKARKARKLMLLTHAVKLAPAIKLYRSMGFKDVPLTAADRQKYGLDRIDTRMEMTL